MNAEALQQLLTMVGTAGEGAYTLAMVYVAGLYVIKAAWLAVATGLIYGTYRVAISMVHSASILSDINNVLGTEATMPMYHSERKRLVTELQALADKQ